MSSGGLHPERPTAKPPFPPAYAPQRSPRSHPHTPESTWGRLADTEHPTGSQVPKAGRPGRARRLPAWPSQSFQTGAWGSASLRASGTERKDVPESHPGLESLLPPPRAPTRPGYPLGAQSTQQLLSSIFSDIQGH